MRYYFIILLAVLLSGCVKHPEVQNIDFLAVEKAASVLFYKTKKTVVIPQDKIPAAIKKLNPIEVRIDMLGVYIVYGRMLSKESGIIISKQLGMIESIGGSGGFIPEIKHVQGNVYTYIKG